MQLGIPSEKISVIPNGVDLEKFHPLPKEDARRKLALPNDKKIILSVGRLIPEKGFDLLIKAVKILVEGHGKENLHLVIAGEGRYRKELERLVFSLHLEEHVYLPGPIPHQELHCWYSAADLFCLASDREGWPNVLLEALACETPVVATAVWGVPEIIRSDNVGLLTKRNEREIAAAISQALHKPWQAIGLRRYASGHTWNQVALSVLHTLESTLAHRNNRSHDDLIPQKAGFTPSVHE